MTIEEAISYITHHAFISDDVKEMAIVALEKQIPKNPYLSGDGYWNGQLVYDIWDCTNCGKSYEVDYDNYDYCPECGQKIDWKVEEC